MNNKIQMILLACSLLVFNACSKDDDYDKTAPNMVLIDGVFYDLNGSFIEDTHELQEDKTWKYSHELIIFGGDIKYTNLQDGYNGKGFILAAKMYTKTVDLDAGNYKIDNSLSSSTCLATYVTNFDVDGETNPPFIEIAGGTINVQRGSTDVVSFDVVDANGKRIKGTFDKPILGLYR